MIEQTNSLSEKIPFDKNMDISKRGGFMLRRRILRNKLLLIGGFIILIIGLIAWIAPYITHFNPYELEATNRLQSPNAIHWFGTDDFGRDLFSRVVYGARVSLLVGISVSSMAGVIGLFIGMYAAYYKLLDNIFMRIADGLMAFPSILLAIAIMAVIGPKTINVIIALVIVETPVVARVVRSATLVIKEQTYVEAARAHGASAIRIIWQHIAPNVFSPLIVQVTYVFSVAMIIEAALSFLGAGIPAPNPSWGNILYDGKTLIQVAWWMTVFPGLFLLFAVLGSNLLGDGIRDLLDPHSNKSK